MTVPFGRLMTAMITPMTDDGELDLKSTAELARALVASGTEAIVATGSTGEAPALSDEEKIQVWVTVKEAVGPGVPVIAGATDNNTRKSVELAKKAERLGLDGLLLTVPAYSKPPQAGLIAHFTLIAEATRLPCVLYNIPGRAALNMVPETTLALAQLPNVVGVKEGSADLAQIGQIIEQAPDGFEVWSGNDSDTLAVLRAGGYGVVSVASHLVGRQIAELMTAELAGNPERADVLDRRLAPLVDMLFCESNPIPLKFALNEIGFAVGPPRLPLLPASEAAQAQIRAELAKGTIDIKAPARA
ncbi:MAG: 4-hydroxy-tetrahydrodipicolinate synthase [Chloroflexi bacterium]|nr:4-hydroxy-tetrahydrodipicolinate synthase [Chloroflexota bacterium]MDA1003477.1 4-hydroxy-tetrahydrodipicolinate synthase [Chloroflexota bacterium]